MKVRVGVRIRMMLLLLAGGVVLLAMGLARVSSAAAFTIRVLDQGGQPRSGARVAVFNKICGTYDRLDFECGAETDYAGSAQLELDPQKCYIVEVRYSEFAGSEENWIYNYIEPKDWPGRTFYRTYPWLDLDDPDGIIMPLGACPVGEPQSFEVAVRHGYEDTDFDQPIRIHMIIDDDGAPPYLYEQDSESQPLAIGQIRFQLDYTPLAAGHYLVRFRTDSRWERNPWFITDDGGWQWHLDVGNPTPTPTATATATASPTLTATPTPTPTSTPTPAPCVVEGIVFEDLDRDGLREETSPGVAGVEVLLCTRDGDVVLERAITDGAGRYRFVRIGASSYRVRLGAIPVGYRWTDLAYAVACRDALVFPALDFPLFIWRCGLPVVWK